MTSKGAFPPSGPPSSGAGAPPVTGDSGTAADILTARGVTKTYNAGSEVLTALRCIDLSVKSGQFLAVMGPSGSGKTTLLNCLSGLDRIDQGQVVVAGADLNRLSDAKRTRHRAERMGFIFQAFNLIPVLSAVENVELPLLLAGNSPGSSRKAAVSTLERVGLGRRLQHRPNELSGGEQQRVAVARALAGKPSIVWADEPTGNLDTETAAAVMDLLGELHSQGLTVVLVTHDRALAALTQRTIVVRDGRIVSDSDRDKPGGSFSPQSGSLTDPAGPGAAEQDPPTEGASPGRLDPERLETGP